MANIIKLRERYRVQRIDRLIQKSDIMNPTRARSSSCGFYKMPIE